METKAKRCGMELGLGVGKWGLDWEEVSVQ